MGAHFVANVLKYNKKSSNFGSRRLVTESLFLTLLTHSSTSCICPLAEVLACRYFKIHEQTLTGNNRKLTKACLLLVFSLGGGGGSKL